MLHGVMAHYAIGSLRKPQLKAWFSGGCFEVELSFLMNSTSHFIHKVFLVPAIACAILATGPEARASTHQERARLIVQRTPNFGTDLVVHLLIDGRTIANIPRNQSYHGFLASGGHILTVVGLPNTDRRPPTSTRLVAQSGHTYIYTAAWEPDRGLVLRRSAESNDTTRVNAR